jgi:GNAT superfamily N-acetyltransferase
MRQLAKDWIIVISALAVFGLTGKTPLWAVQSMVRLFCASGGHSNDLIARLFAAYHPPQQLPENLGVLSRLEPQQIAEAATALRERGFYLYEQRVPAAICDRLLQFALTHPATVRLRDGERRDTISAVYDPARPIGVRYDFAEADLINHPDVQALMADPAIINAAQAYLGTEPVADVVAMWWNTAFSDRPDSEAAQYFHFDLDRIKWVKFFIYLTDVTSDSGPHYFIAKSHRTGGIPAALLAKGYARLTDEEVSAHYPAQDFIEFAAPRGTILAEDTRGLHKGQNVRAGHRLVLQIQFSNSRFGPPYPKVAFSALHDRNLRAMAEHHPHIYSAYAAERRA